MQTNTPEILHSISQTLTSINTIMQQMLDKMPEQQGKFRNALEIGLAIVGILMVVGAIDTIVKWIIGG